MAPTRGYELVDTEQHPSSHTTTVGEHCTNHRQNQKVCGFGAIVGLLFFVLALVALLRGHTVDDCAADDVVCTPDGATRGVLGEDGWRFYRVPYALPPTGTLRWQPPVPNRPWRGTLDARTIGEGCVQSSTFTGGEVWGSEDCLYVNVYTPSLTSAGSGHCDRSTALLPTMVYFHGGSFSGGSPDGYDGSALAAFGRVVVVTVAFRLNVFGHLASDAVKARSSDSSAGNFGIQDQRESLRWVQRNIASFCGDPSNVLIFGHSSGAASVANHLVSPPSWPLFHKALIQSGSFTKWGSHSMQLAEQNYRQVVSATGCINATTGSSNNNSNSSSSSSSAPSTAALRLQCLVNSDVAVVARAGDVAVPCRDGCAWAPVVDNVELTAYPLELLAAGRFKQRIPLLLSSTSSDGAGFLDEVPSGLTSATLIRTWLESYGNADARALDRLYPRVDAGVGYGTPDDWREYRRHTDASYLCTQKWAAHYFAKEGSDVYQMVFDYDYDRATGMERRSHHPVAHGAEIPFVFMSRLGWVWSPPWWEQKEKALEMDEMDAGPRQVAEIIAGYWAAFAHTGDPNSPAIGGVAQQRPVWPRSQSQSDGGRPTAVESGNANSTRSSTHVDVSLWLSTAARGGVQITEVRGAQEAQCEFWRERWGHHGAC